MEDGGQMTRQINVAALVFALMGSFASAARAQSLGTFTWRLSPYCNVLALNVIQQGGTYLLTGTDDGCGTTPRSPVTGTAFLNAGGGVTMGLTAILPGGGARNYAVNISATTFSGTWSDGGESGTLTFAPTLPASGSPRPLLADSVFAFGQIREDGSIRNGSSRVVSVDRPGTGIYCINFSTQPAQNRVEGSVVGLAGDSASTLFAHVTNGQGAACPIGNSLRVFIVNGSGTPTNGRFSFVVP
jgi:hypothetical protein